MNNRLNTFRENNISVNVTRFLTLLTQVYIVLLNCGYQHRLKELLRAGQRLTLDLSHALCLSVLVQVLGKLLMVTASLTLFSISKSTNERECSLRHEHNVIYGPRKPTDNAASVRVKQNSSHKAIKDVEVNIDYFYCTITVSNC